MSRYSGSGGSNPILQLQTIVLPINDVDEKINRANINMMNVTDELCSKIRHKEEKDLDKWFTSK
jgi:hypothetical protein